MLPDTLLTIEQSILSRKLSPNKVQKFNKLLSIYSNRKHKYIYPGNIIRQIGIDMKEAYLILDEIETLGFIRKVFEVTCPNCKHSTGEIYESLNELPDEFYCDNCHHDFDPINGVIIIYKVLVE